MPQPQSGAGLKPLFQHSGRDLVFYIKNLTPLGYIIENWDKIKAYLSGLNLGSYAQKIMDSFMAPFKSGFGLLRKMWNGLNNLIPRGSQDVFNGDKVNGIDIVTLISTTHPTVILPSSYIVSFPDITAIPYNNVFLVMELGILPDKTELRAGIDYCKEVIQDFHGVTPTVQVVAHPIAGLIDSSQHEALVNARLAKMKERDTIYKQFQDAQVKIAQQAQRIALLEAELKRRL